MPDRDVWAVVGGTGQMTVFEPAESTTTLSRGDVFILDERHSVLAEHDPSDPLAVVAVHFDGGPPLDLHYRVIPTEFLIGLVDRCLRARLGGDETRAMMWLELALQEIAASQVARAGQNERLATLMDQIRDRPGDDWRVSVISDRLGTTPQHAGRLFRRASGISPKEYVIQARTHAAQAYLEGSSLPIKRIAAELGYHDEFHFSRQFRDRVGVSPSEWRDRSVRR